MDSSDKSHSEKQAQTTSSSNQFEFNKDAVIDFRQPQSTDGYPVHQLIERCPPLDTNSIYCNLLQCSHFAETCVLAECQGQVVGFLSGYIPPGRSDVIFVWQMAVDSAVRGRGMAKRLINALLERDHLRQVRFLETTITPGNRASEAVFEKLAQALDADLEKSVLFGKASHFGGQHDDEVQFRIGPFNSQAKS